MSNHRIIEVCLPARKADILSYRLPDAAFVPLRGTRVVVPIRNRIATGIVWQTHAQEPEFVLKDVIKVLSEEPVLSEHSLNFLEWMAAYYLQPLGIALHEALPAGILNAENLDQTAVSENSKKTRRKKADEPVEAQQSEQFISTLNPEQLTAFNAISAAISRKKFQPFLLHGVTGSGKTEVYLRAFAECLSYGRQAIMMVPEIAMIPQIIRRFQDRFGDSVAVIHSGLPQKKRVRNWIDIKKGRVKVVIGTRSAIFAPVQDLGLIVVDEEHDPSYKQGERFFYNARDMAVVVAKMTNIPVVLGSATPSLTSYFHAMNRHYTLLEMPYRVESRPLPEVQIVDRKPKTDGALSEKRGSDKTPYWLGRELHAAIAGNLERKEQTLLFLNRRGFATYIFCEDCGHVFRCKKCDISLSMHKINEDDQSLSANLATPLQKSDGRLVCHYCGWHIPAMPVCPVCHSHNIKAAGYGTQRLFEDISGLFPTARLARLDRDEAASPKKLENILKAFSKNEIDILIGTQMTTKGHDFPNLTLVGVVWADISLNFPEFNAAERTFQLLSQVAGRAGRGEKPGRVIIQTMLPNSQAIQCAMRHDYKGFYENEIRNRRLLDYPPFSRLIKLTLDEKDSIIAETYIRQLAAWIREQIIINKIKTEVIGPSPCPIARLKDAFRWQLLFKASGISAQRHTGELLTKYCEKELAKAKFLRIDVDPISFL